MFHPPHFAGKVAEKNIARLYSLEPRGQRWSKEPRGRSPVFCIRFSPVFKFLALDYPFPRACLNSLTRGQAWKNSFKRRFNSSGSGFSLSVSHSCSSNSHFPLLLHIKMSPKWNLSSSDTNLSGNS